MKLARIRIYLILILFDLSAKRQSCFLIVQFAGRIAKIPRNSCQFKGSMFYNVSGSVVTDVQGL